MVLGTVVVFAQTGNFYMAARHAVALGYNLAFFAVIVGLLGWLPDRARRIGTLLVYAFLAIFTVISAVHFILYGELTGLPSLYAALDTTMAEGSEYLSTIIRPVHISIAALAALPLCIAAASEPDGAGPLVTALIGIGVHTLAMLVTTTVVAVAVYEWVGLEILRRAWINVDLVWTFALVAAGVWLLIG